MRIKYFLSGFILIFVVLLVSSASLSMGEARAPKTLAAAANKETAAPKQIVLDDFSVKDLNKLGGRTAAFVKKPCTIKLDWVKEGEKSALKIDFNKKEEGWCGLYTVLKDAEGNYFDASSYKAVVFMVKGAQGGEKFELGLADRKWEEKEDSVKSGEITDYLDDGVTKDWQQAVIPLVDFERLRFNQLTSLAINFIGTGEGTLYIRDLAFTKETGLIPKAVKIDKEVFVIEDFETENQNALGGLTAFFERAPSAVQIEWAEKGAYQGKSLRVYFKKDEFGWCGAYTQLKKKGRYLDMGPFRTLSFMVKGDQGGEAVEIKMADRTWEKKGDAIRGGTIAEFLKGGITTSWQEVRVPLDYFGDLDFSEISSLVFNFNKEGEGVVYFDNITFRKEKIKL